MALVDEHGRLFGRLNLVDAFLVLVFLGLIPLGYGAYVLFRTPPPRITAVEPATLQHNPNLRVTIRGENLRPYMRVSIGDLQGRTFLFYNSESAEVDIGTISPGVYDVVLFDHAQERGRLTKALTITPPPLPTTTVDIVGAIRNLNADLVKQFTTGTALTGFGTVLKVGQPKPSVARANVGPGTVEIPIAAVVDLPLVIRANCYLQSNGPRTECVGGGVALAPDAFLLLPTPVGNAAFQVDQVRAPADLVEVEARVRFVGDPEALALLKPGDLDVGVARNELASGASVVSADGVRRVSSTITVLSGTDVLAGEALAVREATLRVPAQPGVTAWRYAGEDLRVGGTFRFITPAYELRGSVIRMTLPATLTNGAPTPR